MVTLGLCTLGCPPKETKEPPPKTTPPGQSGAPSGVEQPTAKAPEKNEETRTMAQLHPVIQEVSEPGATPGSVTVEFSQPIVARARVQVLPTTRLTITPPVEGSLEFTSRSTLRFTPTTGFAPETRYEVRLDGVQTQRGSIVAEGGTHTRTFETPALALLRADLHKLDTKRKRAEVDLVFSANVDWTSVKSRSNFDVSGRAVNRVSYLRQANKRIVRATITDARLDHEVALNYVLKAGAQALANKDRTAGAGAAKIQTPSGKPIQIFASSIREGSGGFYVHVVCTDEGTGQKPRYYWDSGTRRSYRVTNRCVLDDEDAQHTVHFSPAVKFSVSPTRGGFRVLGNFKRGSYSMRIDADARSTAGGVLKSPYTTSFSVPARSPKLSFTAQGRYLPQSAWKNLAIRHQNVGEVELLVRHIPPENLTFWMSGHSETADNRNSNLILKKKLPLSGPPDVLKTSWVDVANLLPEAPRGVLEIEVRGAGASAKSRLLLTDLNLIAKREQKTGKVHVWAIGIHDNAPVSGVQIKQVVKSGRSLSTCKTAWSGHCALDGLAKEAVDKSQPFAVIAQNGRDLTYLKYDELKTPIEEAKIHGRAFSQAQAYTAAIYLDRGVYRPGETAHLAAIVRDRQNEAPASGMPLTLQLIDPKRKVARKLRVMTNSAGMLASDLRFASFADTGVYRARLSAGKKVVGELSFNVEEFVPERMKVETKFKQASLHLSDTAKLDVNARYLFGGSAEGSRVELNCSLIPATFKPENNRDFDYGIWREKTPGALALGATTGALGAGGESELACPDLTSRGKRGGAARLSAKVAVFESGSGRTTQAQTSAMVHPERFYIGLKSNAERVKSGDEIQLQGVVVDWAGQIASATSKIDLTLYRVERENDWIYDEDEGRWNHRRYQRLAKDAAQQLQVKQGRFSVKLPIVSNASGYVISARAGNARTDLYLEGSGSWWWWDWSHSGQDVTPRPMKPSALTVLGPKTVEVGKPTKLTVRAPFKGRALLTVETDEVLRHEWIDVNKGDIEWSFTVPKFSPNVYVSAFVVKDPHADSAKSFLPSRAFGVRSMAVKPAEYEGHLKLTAPDEVRSSSKLEVKLDLRNDKGEAPGATFVTVAAVDEGILQLTRFQSPNPFHAIFDKRALGVATFETIGWNLLLPAGDVGRSTGGDARGNDPGRVQPIKPVALWSGLLEVPKSGQLTVPFDVPQYRGQLRVMAVAAGSKRMAHADRKVLVRDPLVLQTTLPRFLTLGDQVEVPVFVTNLSGKKQDVQVRISATSLAVPGSKLGKQEGAPLKFLDEAQRTLSLDDQKNGKVIFKLEGLRAVGAATLKVQVSGGGFTSEESLDVPFLPAAPKTRQVQRIELTQKLGDKIDLRPYLQGWLPTTERSTFWVTNNPYGDTFDHLKYLLRYPYGCMEQTTSSTRPLLFLSRFLGNVDPKLVNKDRIEGLVMHGVERIFSMQTPSGGFGYWPGATEPTAWGTAYATHMLLDAQKLKYPVSKERIEDALGWIGQELTRRSSSTQSRSYYWRTAEPYMHYVLALAGKGRKAQMLKLIDKVQAEKGKRRQAREELYMLKAGLYMMGDHRFESDLKSPDISPIEVKRHNTWSFYSDRRARGFMLSTFADLFAGDKAGDRLAELVASALRGHHSSWYTTQELVWGITGLGKYVGQVAQGYKPAKLYANGKALAPEGQGGADKPGDRTWDLYRASEQDSLQLEVAAAKGERLFLIISSEGVQKNAKYEYGGQGLKLQRTYRRASGEPARLGALALGDVVYVELKVKNNTGERVQNLALVDRLPAGFEIENPRLGRGQTVSWVKRNERWSVDHMNVRDDRIELFGALERGQERTVVYAARAVSAGRYTIPPAEMEAMYDPERWAREAGGVAVIGGQ